MASRRQKPEKRPKFVQTVEQKIVAFLDWIAPVVDWVGDQAEKYKAASDAVPPPSKKWVHKRRVNTRNMTVTVFMLFLTVMAVVALYLPNRPSYSELEQRNLTEFPTPTVMGVLNGGFFDEINTWFADTFPGREKFLAAQTKIESLYGFRGSKIVGEVGTGDEIPDVGQTPEDSSDSQPQTDPADHPEGADTSAAGADASESGVDGGESSGGDSSQEEPEQPDSGTGSEEDFDDAETLGGLYVNKDSAYEYYNFVQSIADDYIAMMNSAAKQLKGKVNVYDIIVPTSMDICVPEKKRSEINTSDQEKAINYFYSSMSSDVKTVSVMDTIRARQAEGDYLYFRTDHHWTALGAYYAYTEYAAAAGKTAAALEDFDEYVFEGFTGSFYREQPSAKMAANPDTVYAYGPKSTNEIYILQDDGTELNYNIISDGDTMSASLKYLAFIGGDNPFSVIENPEIDDGSAVMLVKESFGNCFAPYLVENYQYVYVVDYRYIGDVDSRGLAELAEDYNVDDVVFLNNISATRNKSLVAQMADFVD